jgi:hypothetical protein
MPALTRRRYPQRTQPDSRLSMKHSVRALLVLRLLIVPAFALDHGLRTHGDF